MSTRKKWATTSASQHQAFLDCERFWFFGWILKLSRPESPPLWRGSGIHKESEFYLKTGLFRDAMYPIWDKKGNVIGEHNYRPYVEALVPYFPPACDPDMAVEMRIDVSTPEGLPNWLGYIDNAYHGPHVPEILNVPDAKSPVITDLKTLSDFRYRKTKKELQENIQMVSYAKSVFDMGHEGVVNIGHVYCKAYPKRIAKKPQTASTFTIIGKGQVDDVWGEALETMERMKLVSLAESADDVNPTGAPGRCSKFNGCPFREKCGLTTKQLFQFSKNSEEEERKENTMGFQFGKKTVEKKGETAVEEKTATGGFLGKVQNIVPSDAPGRTTPVKTEEEKVAEAEEKKKKTTTKKTATKRKKKSADSGMTVYLDCRPKKGMGDVEPTLFEDWISPIIMEIDDAVESDSGTDKNGYWELPYAEQKAALFSALKGRALPPAMVVNTSTLYWNDAATYILPNAVHVISAKG